MTRIRSMVWATVLAAMLPAPMVSAQKAPSPHPPKGAKVLFNGKDASLWQHLDGRPVQWTVSHGVLEVKPGTGNIVTKERFRDFQLHLEFREPLMPDAHDQARGNSGLYLQGRYEIQILDSYHNPTYKYGGCGAIYGIKDPDKDVCKPPLQWQTYDVFFRAARFNPDGSVKELPRVTVYWNGVKIHDAVEIPHGTTAGLGNELVAEGPIMLQDHGCPVQFRNIWIVPGKAQ
ncbi:MAG: 3-keto-disaccharide hydrolase [Chthonomonadales bacterium]